MAGESPDRSKQRESSAEPTSGSAGPVPEARTEERAARDPRLGAAETRGGVDTATRVFSVRDLKTDAQPAEEARQRDESPAEAPEDTTAPKTPTEAPETAEGAARGPQDAGEAAAEGPGTGDTAEEDAVAVSGDVSADAVTDGEPAPTGDARLRAAAAAWVRPGDSEDVTETAEAGGTRDAESAGGAGDSGDSSGAGDAGGEKGAAEGEGADDEPEDATPEAESTPTAPEPGEKSTTETNAGPADATVAAEEPNDEEPNDEAPSAEAENDTGTPAGAAAVPEADARPSGGAPADVPADARPAAEPGTGAKPSGEAPADARPSTGPETDAKPSGDAPADARPASEAAGDSEVSGGAGVGADESDGTAPEAAGADESDAVPEAAGADGGSGPQGASAADVGGESGPGVDQPTTMLKRPQVDQPTTMLKLTNPKSDPERTSRFVALKPLDDPATRTKRPTPAPADATAPVPQVGPERTTRQPLPPKPPLDLLAELTNTPPPPQTPVRTIIRRVKIWTPLVILLAVVFAIVQTFRPLPAPTLALTAADSYTFDGSKADLPWPSEGQGRLDINGVGTMGTFGTRTPVPIGSVAKAMTAYIVLKDHPLKPGQEGEKITVDALAEKEGGYDKDNESTLNTVKKGDVLTEKQALSAVMIPSANNIARLLARWDAGSEAAFIKKMNDTAKRLGMTDTTYTDASGLKESTVSTASDQVKLGNELVRIPALMEITKLPNWVDPSGRKWRNYNSLVPYNGAIGIKTGTTTKAGGNLLFAATKDVGGETVTVVGAILGQHTAPIIDTVNRVSQNVMLAAQGALKSAKIVQKGTVVGYVDDGLGGHTPVVVTKDVTAVGWNGFKVKLSFDADDVPHTAKAGARVGTLTVGDGTSGAVKVPVALQKDLTEPGFTAKLKRLA